VAAVPAAAAIAAGQCDAAVAGASSITFPNLGYLYQDGLVASVDGYVRPFDAGADGTVFGDAVASLILRRTDEVAGGLSWGSMRGFAVTNDGGQKAGYAAPSPVGQSNAVMAALRMMGEDPWSISYVEAHATGTRVGDGIEIRGLLDAFSRTGGKAPEDTQVALGSVKGNIAHANCAAGATGFIKTLMMLHHRQLVPVANFQKLNPKIDLGGTPFFVNNELCSWETTAKPLRAGVSSFGIGGTNAHVVLEALAAPAQAVAERAAPRAAFHIVPLSAKTPSALKGSAERLAASLRRPSEGEPSMASVAFTLQTGRSVLPLRKAVVVPSGEGMEPGMGLSVVANAFEKRFPDEEDLEELEEATKKPTVAFVFPGQGSQHLGMAVGLYEQLPLYREAVDRCCELLQEAEHLGFDLRPLVFVRGGDLQEREREFSRPSVLQPSLFVVEYAMSRVLLACGLKPVAVAGHSLGEYVAAVTGGLLSLEAAVGIVSARAKATETLAKDGAMLSVSEWSESELEAIARGEREGLWLAAVNSQLHAVISGEADAVSALEAELKAAGRKCAKLHVRKAFHSGLVADAANTLEGLGVPAEDVNATLPVASNLTGGWMSAAQLRDGKYWTGHMRGTVYWRQNAEKLLSQWQPTAVLEAGPGNTLSALTSKCIPKDGKAPAFVQAMRHPKAENVHDVEALLGGLGRLWELGFAIDWHALHTTVLGQGRVPGLLRMPSYAFDRISLWERPERSVYVEGSAPKDARSASQASAAPAPKSLIRFGKRSGGEPAIRAYCLPFASGSATVFAPWAEQADSAVEIVAIELPGRGGRSDERIPANEAQDESLLNGLCEAILADLRGAQYVLVGFSMGGGLAVELAMRLAEKEAPLPLALYVAGRKPPSSDPSLVGDITMSNEELAEYAFAPPEVARSQEFAEHVVPLLRADLGVDARCERRLSALSLSGRTLPAGLGLEVFCGVSDGVAPFTEAPGWQRFLSAPLGLHYFPGGHEFMQEQREGIIARWRRDAIGRLVQRRSAEVALLSAQAFAAPAAVPAPLAALAMPGMVAAAKSEGAVDAAFPFYAVRWVEAESLLSSGGSAPHRYPTFYAVNLSSELTEGMLEGAVNAAQGGLWVAVVCAATDGILGAEDGVDIEVRQCWKFMRIMQRLIEAGAAAHILVVCAAAAAGAMVAGASKAVAMEEAALKVQRVFLPAARLADASAKMQELVVLAAHHPRESDLWIQDESLSGAVFTQRIEPMAAPSSKMPCVPKVSADGREAAYVLTGATGGLGKAVVEWMLRDQGLAPHQLVLLRRSGSAPLAGSLATCRVVEVSRLDGEASRGTKRLCEGRCAFEARSESGVEDRATKTELRGLRGRCEERRGKRSLARGEEELLSSALAAVQNVVGVFHLAGVLDDGILGGMTEETALYLYGIPPHIAMLVARLAIIRGRCRHSLYCHASPCFHDSRSAPEERVRKVAQPKCGGLVSLMRAAEALQWPLRWILGFSSTSSLFGYAGQSNYCAANAMIDQLASFGAGGVLPMGDRPPCRVLAVNWGPWGEAGMAKVGTKAYQQAAE
jgi:surfactin synthase thioesterase subunit